MDIVVFVVVVVGRESESGGLEGGIGRNHFDVVSLLMAQTYFVAHQFVFHRILQGSVQEYLYLLTLDESHLDDTLAESTMTLHLDNNATFACFQF